LSDFEVSACDRSEALEVLVREIIEAFEIEGAAISDESLIHHLALRFVGTVEGEMVMTKFGPRRKGRFEVDYEVLTRASERLGLCIKLEDRVVDVALALQRKVKA